MGDTDESLTSYTVLRVRIFLADLGRSLLNNDVHSPQKIYNNPQSNFPMMMRDRIYIVYNTKQGSRQ